MAKQIDTVKVMWSDWKEYERTRCSIWARAMGYLRPVENFNIWKKSEFYSRKYFDANKVDNSSFIKKFSS